MTNASRHSQAKAINVRSMIMWAGTLTTVLLIIAATLGTEIRFAHAAAGQILKVVTSDGGSTFYVGRCFRTDFRVQTDNLNANSVDVIIPYNPSYLAPYTGSGCTVAATAINSNHLFPSYPSNTISGNQVIVTGYDPSGTSPVNTGAAPADRTLGHLFWKVLAASGAYNMNYSFTLGSTIDTNMAESGGNGTDVLDAVENLTLVLANDSTAPTYTNLSPASGASNVSVTSGISYTFNDAGAGVNTGSLTTRLLGSSKPLTFSSCTRTNSNRIPSCNVTVGSVGTLAYATNYQVAATGADLARPTANTGSTAWNFSTEDDTDAPYVQSQNPSNGATGVAVNTNIVFHVKDYKGNAGVTPGLGVNIATVSVTVTPAGGSPITYTSASPQFGYTGTSADYTVTINPAADFAQNKVVAVTVDASDLHSPSPNVMSTVSYSFTTVDSDAPTITSFVPAQSATDVAADTNVSFHILDGAGGAGVDIANTSVTVAGTTYTSVSPQFSYTGTSADYAITINPSSNFSGNQSVSVSISTRDLASTPNTASASYSFTIASSCSTCFVDSESPARFTTSAALTNTISFRVKDTGDGILSSSIRITLIGTGAAIPSSPLTLSGSNPMVSITGTTANYLVTITLPASMEVNLPVSVYIAATNVNGLTMAPVGYTISTISGSGTTIVTVQSSCPAVQECTATTTTQPNGGNRDVSRIIESIPSEDLPTVVARRRLPDNTVQDRELTPDELNGIDKCYVDEDALRHRAAPMTPYTDVHPGDWYESAVKSFLDLGILDATKTTFRGNDSAIRAEFAKVLAKLGKQDAEIPPVPTFDDVRKTDWFFPYIEMIAQKGIMKGYGECIGTHPCMTKPGAIISRAEAAAMIVRFYDMKSTQAAPRFTDVSADAWYLQVMQTAADHCVIQGRPGSFTSRPGDPINRAEMIVMLQRAMKSLNYRADCPWGGTAKAVPPTPARVLPAASSSQAASVAASSPAASIAAASSSSSSSSIAATATASSSAQQDAVGSPVHPAAAAAGTGPSMTFVLLTTALGMLAVGGRMLFFR